MIITLYRLRYHATLGHVNKRHHGPCDVLYLPCCPGACWNAESSKLELLAVINVVT